MENASKAAMDKKRRGARKKVEQMVQQKGQPSSSTSMASMHGGIFAEELQEGVEMSGVAGSSNGPVPNFDTFRYGKAKPKTI
jgi:hypothetical protein